MDVYLHNSVHRFYGFWQTQPGPHYSSVPVMGSHLEDFEELVVVLHYQDVSLTVVCYILTRLGGVGGVDACSKTPGTQHTSNNFLIEVV